jgi:hypothetical protein
MQVDCHTAAINRGINVALCHPLSRAPALNTRFADNPIDTQISLTFEPFHLNIYIQRWPGATVLNISTAPPSAPSTIVLSRHNGAEV